MIKINVTKDFRCFKQGESFDFSHLSELKHILLVGENGSGKSTLFQSVRGKYEKPIYSTSMILSSIKQNVSPHFLVESDYEVVYGFDARVEGGSSLENSFDASAYVESGAFTADKLSHGQSEIYLINKFVKRIESQIIKDRTLILLDEFDKGFSLSNQIKSINIINYLVSKGCHVLSISHNIFLIKSSMIVYDMISKKEMLARTYIDSQINKNSPSLPLR